MDQILETVTKYQVLLPLLGATLAAAGGALWVVLQYAWAQSRQRENREFKTYHKLVHELVHGDAQGNVYIDRQVAIIFELRHFPKYYPVTRRILTGCKQSWQATPQYKDRLGTEIDITIAKTKGFLWTRD